MAESRVPFIGRDAELAAVRHLIHDLMAGRGGAVVVVGDAGLGKSSLLAQAVRAAEGEGARCARVGCLPLRTVLPLEPMLHLLHELDLPPGRQVQLPGNTRGGEALIVVARALERSCADGPVLLALDDLQWSDAATRDLVHYGIARLADVPLGWLLTTRPEPLLAGFLHRLGQEAQVDRVELAPFTAAETLELISAVTGDAEDAASLADTLVARSEGNPFFLVELLRALNSDRSGTPQVPESIIAAVLERTERLPHATQEVLTWFAVLPQPVDPMPLHRLAPDTDLEGSLGLLAANRLLAPDADRDLVVHRN